MLKIRSRFFFWKSIYLKDYWIVISLTQMLLSASLELFYYIESNSNDKICLLLELDKDMQKFLPWYQVWFWKCCILQGQIQIFRKRGIFYVGHNGCPMKKILGSRWSKKAKITLETISFSQNISFSIFKFSPFLYTMKAFQWNLIKLSIFANVLVRKEKRALM